MLSEWPTVSCESPHLVWDSRARASVSVLIAIVAGTAALWAALRLASVWTTLLASLIMGVAVSGMHYTGMAAMHVARAPGGGMAAMGGGASAQAFLLPLILGITAVTFVLAAIITLAPTEAEIREDAALMERIAKRSEQAAIREDTAFMERIAEQSEEA